MKNPLLFAAPLVFAGSLFAQHITPGANLYIEPNNGFDTYLTAAILRKHVPLTVVRERTHADFIASTDVEHGKEPGFAQTWVLHKHQRNEDASVTITSARTSAVVWAYSVHKYDAQRGEQSTAEAVAKHLKAVVR